MQDFLPGRKLDSIFLSMYSLLRFPLVKPLICNTFTTSYVHSNRIRTVFCKKNYYIYIYIYFNLSFSLSIFLSFPVT